VIGEDEFAWFVEDDGLHGGEVESEAESRQG
jgi:hypothetical protein